uniref:Uncharacterized protein n=1 Tax=Alexandrium monilatum TaxID=311494 RepID=A0A7S4RB83_9DINO
MAADGSDSVFAFLLAKVTGLIRSSPSAKAEWQAWCDRHAGGVRDASRMDLGSLEFFFVDYERGGILEGHSRGAAVQGPAWPPLAAAAPPVPSTSHVPLQGPAAIQPVAVERAVPQVGPEQPELAQAVKLGQRASPAWKAAWVGYCQRHGHARFDPTRHTREFLLTFLDFAGSQGYSALHATQLAAASSCSPLASAFTAGGAAALAQQGPPPQGPPPQGPPPQGPGAPPPSSHLSRPVLWGSAASPRGETVLSALPPPAKRPCTGANAVPLGGSTARPGANAAPPGTDAVHPGASAAPPSGGAARSGAASTVALGANPMLSNANAVPLGGDSVARSDASAAPWGNDPTPLSSASAVPLGAGATVSGAAAPLPGSDPTPSSASAVPPGANVAVSGAAAPLLGSDPTLSSADVVSLGANVAVSGANAPPLVASPVLLSANAVPRAVFSDNAAPLPGADPTLSSANAVPLGANAAVSGANAAPPGAGEVPPAAAAPLSADAVLSGATAAPLGTAV